MMDAKLADVLARMRVVVQPERLVVVSLPPVEWGRLQRRADQFHSPFCLTFTPQEVCLVCREVEWDHAGRGLRAQTVERGYRMITLDVELETEMVDYLKVVTQRLAEAGVPTRVISMFHRDHLLVRESDVERARAVLGAFVQECAEGMVISSQPLEQRGGCG